MHCLFLLSWHLTFDLDLQTFGKKFATIIFETYSSRWTFWYITTLINKENPRDDISNCTNMDRAAVMVMWHEPVLLMFIPLSHGGSTWNLASICLGVSKEKKFDQRPMVHNAHLNVQLWRLWSAKILDLYPSLNRLPIWNSQNCSMFPLAFVAGSLQGHWCGFISRNYLVWPIFFLVNVFIALKGTHFWILFAFTAAGVVPCGGRKTSPRTSTIVQFIFYFWSFEISVNILKKSEINDWLDSYSRQVFDYLNPI